MCNIYFIYSIIIIIHSESKLQVHLRPALTSGFVSFCAFVDRTSEGQEMGALERGCNNGTQSGIEPRDAAARTQPLYMGRPLYRLS